MTYITGWRNQTSVFIAADSAITYEQESLENAKIWSDVSTFGETHIIGNDKVVQEQWLKIYNFNNKLILAFAGNVSEAYEAIKWLKMVLEVNEQPDLRGSFKYIYNTYRKISIIAGFVENEQPVLISVNANGTSGYKEHLVYEDAYSGTIDAEFIKHTQEFYNEIRNSEQTDEQILISMCSVIQSYKYVKPTITNGVGGLISGIRVDKFGVSWQKDIAYIPIQYNGAILNGTELSEIFGNAEIISVLIRDNLVFVNNPYTHWRFSRRPFGNYQPIRILESESWKESRFTWANNWSHSVNQLIDECTYDYYVFISKTLPIVISVFSKEFLTKKQVFMYNQEKQAFMLNSELLLDFLLKILIPEDDEFTIKTFF
ncbi:hypothetical protein [Hugenholtzia roseola]|uniref:hypothetical protein n=1 Tax=Hugenholtzia roseola TaxID=1002 RepID=UPI0004077B1F|nr:hypothetical protein [Hugenholtzia roseola]